MAELSFPWAPALRRCPHAVIEPEAFVAIEWWRDWTKLRCLPFGGTDLMAEPAYVYEAIAAVETTNAEVDADEHRKAAAEIEEAKRKAGQR